MITVEDVSGIIINEQFASFVFCYHKRAHRDSFYRSKKKRVLNTEINYFGKDVFELSLSVESLGV
jgi:hypothetical protein